MYRSNPFHSILNTGYIGLDMCKVVPKQFLKSPSALQASSPLEASFKSLEAFRRKSPSSLLVASFKPLQASRSLLHLRKASSPSSLLKSPSSSIQALLKPSEGEAFFKPFEAPLKLPSSPRSPLHLRTG